jgi:hypothetical protein
VLYRALAVRPEARFPDAFSFAEALSPTSPDAAAGLAAFVNELFGEDLAEEQQQLGASSAGRLTSMGSSGAGRAVQPGIVRPLRRDGDFGPGGGGGWGVSEPSASVPAPPGGGAPQNYGPYLLLEKIGSGGMAEVFRAIRKGPEGFVRLFALKRIIPRHAESRDFVQMFINEARLSALLNHPNLVQVYDFGEVEGSYYLAMEFLKGRTVLSVMRSLHARVCRFPPRPSAISAARWRWAWPTPTACVARTARRWGWSTGTSTRPTSCC